MQTVEFIDGDNGSELGALVIGSNFGPFDFTFLSVPSRDIGTFVVSPATDIFTCVAHGLANGTKVRVKSTGSLPDPLLEGLVYFIVSSLTDTFKLSLTVGGPAIDITNLGVGTHTVVKRGTPLDLTGWSVFAWVKNAYEDSDPDAILDLAPTIATPAQGLVRINLTASQTDTLEAGYHFWSLTRVDPTGIRLRPDIGGRFYIERNPTHPPVPPPT